MTNEEIINQLNSLKCHCQEMGEAEARNGDSSSNLWFRDVEALDAAINRFNQEPEKNSCEECEHQYKSENQLPCADCMYNHRSYFEPRKVASWHKEAYSMVYKCSNCKKTCPGGIKYSFCPNCGAKMEEVEK